MHLSLISTLWNVRLSPIILLIFLVGDGGQRTVASSVHHSVSCSSTNDISSVHLSRVKTVVLSDATSSIYKSPCSSSLSSVTKDIDFLTKKKRGETKKIQKKKKEDKPENKGKDKKHKHKTKKKDNKRDNNKKNDDDRNKEPSPSPPLLLPLPLLPHSLVSSWGSPPTQEALITT